MGLDYGDLVFRIEDEFGISFDDDEAVQLRSVGDVYQLIVAKVGSTSSFLSSRAFYRTRRALVAGLEAPRRSIRPTTALAALFPEVSRKEQWRRVGTQLGLRFPRLQHSKGWKDLFLVVSMVVSAIPIVALWWALYAIGWIWGVGVVLFVIPALVLWVLAISRFVPRMERATPRLASVLPYDTVEELAISVVALNEDDFEPMKSDNHPPSKDAIWKRVVAVFSELPGVDPGQIPASGAMAPDLGVN